MRFDGEAGLRHAKTAECTGRRVVGVHGVAIGFGIGDIVGPGGVRGGTRHDFLAQRGVGSGVAVQLGFDGGQAAVALCTELDLDLGGVALGVNQQAFVPVKEQLDRSAGNLCQQGGMRLPGEIFFAAESAAHQLPDDAHAFGRPAQDARHLVAVGIGDLRADVDLHAPIGERAGNAALWFQEGVIGDGGMEGVLEDQVCLGKTGRHVSLAHLDMLEQISAFMQLGSIRLARLHRIGDDGLGLEFDLDQLQGGQHLVAGFGGNDGDRIAYIAHALANANQRRPVVNHQPVVVLAGDVIGGQHSDHTGRSAGF